MFTRSQFFLAVIACLICVALARPEGKRFNNRAKVASSTVASSSTTRASFATPTIAPRSVSDNSEASGFTFTYSLKDTTPLADGQAYLSSYPSMAAASRSAKKAAKKASKAAAKAAKSKKESD